MKRQATRPAKPREPRTKKSADAKRILHLVEKTIDAVYVVHRRLQKLERLNRERVIHGFCTDAQAYAEAEEYRDIDDIAEDAEIG